MDKDTTITFIKNAHEFLGGFSIDIALPSPSNYDKYIILPVQHLQLHIYCQ